MLHWGVIGAGDIVRRRVAPALRDSPRCRFVAVSRAREQLKDEALALGAERWYPRWRDLVADADVQSVYVATPVSLHAEQTIAAAEAGKHVLCEKPMAMHAAECDRMIAACRANGVTLGVAYYRRFYPIVARIRNLLAAGEIGDPVFAQMNAFEPFDPPADHPRRWLLTPALSGGGPMMDFGCHRIDLLLYVFGPVASTGAVTSNAVFRGRDVEDTAAVVLKFASGACGSVVVTHAAADRQDTFQVFGTGGSLHTDDLNAGMLRIRTAAGERTESHPPASNVHRPLIEDFVDAVCSHRQPAVDGGAGRAVTLIEDQIYGVASTGD